MQQALAVEEDPHAGQTAFARADAGGRIVAARDEDAQHRAGLGIVVGGDHRVDGRGERVDVRLGQVGHRRGRGETAQMVLQRDRKTLPHGRGLEDAVAAQHAQIEYRDVRLLRVDKLDHVLRIERRALRREQRGRIADSQYDSRHDAPFRKPTHGHCIT